MTADADRPRPYRRQVLMNTLSTGVANVWAIVVTLVCLPLLLRGLGESAFGTWVLLQTFSATTGWLSLADAGVGTATTRDVARLTALREESATARTAFTSVMIHLGIGALAAVVLVAAGRSLLPLLFHTPTALRPALRLATTLFAVQVVVELLTKGLSACIEGAQRVDVARGVDVARRTGVAVATAAAAVMTHRLVPVAIASLGASLVGPILAVPLFRRHVGVGFASPTRTDAARLLRYGATVGMLAATGVLHRTMDRVIVGALVGPRAVALVEIATQVQNGAGAILSASSYAAISSSSWLDARGDRHKIRELLTVGTKYSLLATAPLAVTVMVLAHPLVVVWVGRTYLPAAELTVLALVYILLAAPLQVGSNLLQGVGRAGDVLRAAAAGVVVNLVASVALVLAFGVAGTFVGTIIGSLVVLPPLARAFLRAAEEDPGDFAREALLPVLAPVVAAAAGAACVLFALPSRGIVTLALGGGVAMLAAGASAWRFGLAPQEIAGLWVVGGRRPRR